MEQSFTITDLGRFGGSICQTLVGAGQEVLAIDSNEDRVNEYMNTVTHIVVANVQDEMMSRSLRIWNFDYVVVTVGEDVRASILVTLMVKGMGVPNVLTKAVSEYHARVLDKIGADMIAHSEWDMGVRTTHKLVSRNILDYTELSSESSLAEVRVTNPRSYNKILAELDSHQRFGLTAVAIRRSKVKVITSLDTSEIVREDNSLLAIGDTADVDLLDEKMNG